MDLKDAWNLILSSFREQRALDRKRKAYQTFTRHNLTYPLIQEMFEAAARQNPGFYAKLIFPDLTSFEFGVKPKSQRTDGETY